MANLTLAEIEYAEDIKNQVQTARRLISVHESEATNIMSKLTNLYNSLEDAASKQAVLDIRTAWLAQLQANTAI